MNLINKLFSVLIIIISLTFNTSIAKSLNTRSEHVIELNANNFYQNVYNQRSITLVEYYLNWCPHCIQFATVWEQFAKDIKDWKIVVKVTRIDCAASDLNGQECQLHGINRFPQIEVFDPNSQYHYNGHRFELQENVKDLRKQLIDWILNSTQTSASNLNLFPISIASRNELFNSITIHSNLHNLIFLEKHPTHLGAEILLDFSSFNEYINMYRVYDKTGSLSQELFPHSLRLPALIQIHKNQTIELIASAHSDNEEHLRQQFGLKIKNLIKIDKTEGNDNHNYKDNNVVITDVMKNPIKQKLVPKTPKPLSMADLYNTLRYSLHKEVTRYSTLNSSQVLVLKKYITVVHKYFPFDNENVHRFFKRMKIWFSNKTTEIKTENFKAAMKISDGYLPPMVQWLHCAGSEPHFRGYPCGLWSLFHVMTVSEYQMNFSNTSHEVLDLMRDFIINFFSCEDCAKHFEKSSRKLHLYLQSPESSVLWLWRIHNQVNQRTGGSAGEDPYYPKIQYPSRQNCHQCYQSNNEFNETNVLQFLLQTYGQKFLTKSGAYYSEQKFNQKNSVNISFVNPLVFTLVLVFILF